ncbi:TetR family transcriptional regulator [Bacillus pseudomycoides]|uniref:TetR family transcriptional regulator n=1 Tax=Bacillus pseudomycoides TaxID=64104 RepID=A0AA91V8V4_9BACI|nr:MULTISPECIES: TetR/AcrR family transcriptional regulator [Bacillus]PEB51323.1 TetR family transcriptional regulator [Bacillus sp. AFS098217]PED80646.1 TetR family transcriptional regulator [Bacillus pseudomycoides]PEU16999.1 TetR family transcriptional regulator [Bacillus sp. AFS019443]PEU20923.1 TetR family transcriptional regulator [Bacillus sp. AFS014408]PFW59973.1 TetR family transcriptional regulator [Bacillus sp. AFS075034]
MSIKNSNDPRVKRTRQAIRDALISLIHEKSFDSITVQDIAEKATVNRATFYSHYYDKYDLLDKSIQEILTTLADILKPKNLDKSEFKLTLDTPHPVFLSLFSHIAENAFFYQVMLGENGIPKFSSQMMKAIQTNLLLSLSISQPNEEKLVVPRDILISYVTGAHLGMVISWLKQNMPYTPHYMALQLSRLIILGPYTAAGLN